MPNAATYTRACAHLVVGKWGQLQGITIYEKGLPNWRFVDFVAMQGQVFNAVPTRRI